MGGRGGEAPPKLLCRWALLVHRGSAGASPSLDAKVILRGRPFTSHIETPMSIDTKQQVTYLVFDIEAIADGALVSKIRYPNEGVQPAEAVARYRAELMASTGKDVLPVTFMLPISVAVAKVD